MAMPWTTAARRQAETKRPGGGVRAVAEMAGQFDPAKPERGRASASFEIVGSLELERAGGRWTVAAPPLSSSRGGHAGLRQLPDQPAPRSTKSRTWRAMSPRVGPVDDALGPAAGARAKVSGTDGHPPAAVRLWPVAVARARRDDDGRAVQRGQGFGAARRRQGEDPVRPMLEEFRQSQPAEADADAGGDLEAMTEQMKPAYDRVIRLAHRATSRTLRRRPASRARCPARWRELLQRCALTCMTTTGHDGRPDPRAGLESEVARIHGEMEDGEGSDGLHGHAGRVLRLHAHRQAFLPAEH